MSDENTSTTAEPAKLDLRSADIAADRRHELLRLFPEVRTEGGKVDFDQLKRTLGETVDSGRERYGMTWPGKADCFKAIQTPTLATLRPSRQESVNFDTTEHLIIEGDNLEVLKLLQKSYLGKVKMIYIDPPYNTGNDFIYPDNFSESLQTYLQYTGQLDSEGRKFSTNTEADGRFHSKWLNMMYPRLYLAKNLLRDDGIIFISIDDGELRNLRALCDEVFGEENFVDNIVWKKRYGGGAKEKHLVTLHEYVLMYARSIDQLEDIFVPLTQEAIDRYYKNKDANFESRGPFRTHPLESMKSFEERENLRFAIEAPDGQMVMPKRQWRWSPARVAQAAKAGELYFSRDREGQWVISSKQYLRDADGQRETKFFSVIDDVYTQHGTNEIVDLFGDAQVFGFPKPSRLVSKLAQFATESGGDDLVLDFLQVPGPQDRRFFTLTSRMPVSADSSWFSFQRAPVGQISPQSLRLRASGCGVSSRSLTTRIVADSLWTNRSGATAAFVPSGSTNQTSPPGRLKNPRRRTLLVSNLPFMSITCGATAHRTTCSTRFCSRADSYSRHPSRLSILAGKRSMLSRAGRC